MIWLLSLALTPPAPVMLEVWNTTSDPALLHHVSGAPAGDVNGDGADDVVVSAFQSVSPYSTYDFLGQVLVYFGSPAGPAESAAWTLSGDTETGSLVSTARSAGDVNGDGFDDLLLGLPYAANPSGTVGAASVLLGSAEGLATEPAWTVLSDDPYGSFGAAAAAGDVNGDGYDDVLVGESGYSRPGITDEARVALYTGSASGPTEVEVWAVEEVAGSGFGGALASAGDVNGDGYDDIAIGSSCNDTDEATGRIDVFHGSASGLSPVHDWTAQSDVPATDPCTQFGNQVASAGDVNGDGFGDLAAGAPYERVDGVERGTASVFLGSAAGLEEAPSWFVDGPQEGSQFGMAASSAGDVNGDGYGDLVVGASGYTGATSNEGQVSVFLGGPAGLDRRPAWTHESGEHTALFGTRVASAGDVNADGFGDVLVLAFQGTYENGTHGSAHVFVGPLVSVYGESDGGCGCDSGARPSGFLVAVLVALSARLRRRT